MSVKLKIIKKFSRSKNDTGSPEVQIALLSLYIYKLSVHLTKFKKDDVARRGLMGHVSKRKKLIKYCLKKKCVVMDDIINKIKCEEVLMNV